ncbi:hypothetical protein [Deinococcus peraridilitoris]|uniref:Uncharacterized protein n=1 Tax=Deinococcus peraridilitoris (strain DSM 19664 / LMG 22246 / CIP 109416 / KR-200) TaxID=937777 RepID=K9ZZ29_DEIPD|nr:hypothetical protein [Deinococcus peraridilitoris]AFZ66162.1 hypothetical protein Deipe_0567 [Deinococcus peraridilitoris DSM 19664]
MPDDQDLDKDIDRKTNFPKNIGIGAIVAVTILVLALIILVLYFRASPVTGS